MFHADGRVKVKREKGRDFLTDRCLAKYREDWKLYAHAKASNPCSINYLLQFERDGQFTKI